MKFKALRSLAALFLLMCATSAQLYSDAPRKSSQKVKAATKPMRVRTQNPLTVGSSYRGWDYIVEKLRADDVPQKEIDKVYKSKRMPEFTYVPFSLEPREGHYMYSGFLKEEKLNLGTRFLKENKQSLSNAENAFAVSRYVVTAILLVETQLGKRTGEQQIIYRLSRVASVKDPRNIENNLNELRKTDPSVTYEQVLKRADYLERTFYPEVPALLEIARTRKVDVLGIKGSFAGAFGLPQFLPSSYLRFAVDGNSDGTISLYDRYDAIHSTAHYLNNFGWQEQSAIEAQRKVIWAYNRSDAYIDAVLTIADILRNRELMPGSTPKKVRNYRDEIHSFSEAP